MDKIEFIKHITRATSYFPSVEAAIEYWSDCFREGFIEGYGEGLLEALERIDSKKQAGDNSVAMFIKLAKEGRFSEWELAQLGGLTEEELEKSVEIRRKEMYSALNEFRTLLLDFLKGKLSKDDVIEETDLTGEEFDQALEDYLESIDENSYAEAMREEGQAEIIEVVKQRMLAENLPSAQIAKLLDIPESAV